MTMMSTITTDIHIQCMAREKKNRQQGKPHMIYINADKNWRRPTNFDDAYLIYFICYILGELKLRQCILLYCYISMQAYVCACFFFFFTCIAMISFPNHESELTQQNLSYHRCIMRATERNSWYNFVISHSTSEESVCEMCVCWHETPNNSASHFPNAQPTCCCFRPQMVWLQLKYSFVQNWSRTPTNMRRIVCFECKSSRIEYIPNIDQYFRLIWNTSLFRVLNLLCCMFFFHHGSNMDWINLDKNMDQLFIKLWIFYS